jgi:hypothetical protein
MEFQELTETIRAAEASAVRLHEDGVRAGGRRTVGYLANLAEAAQLVADVLKGRRPVYRLEEAMSTSDFPILFGDLMDRKTLASYQVITPAYRSYCAVDDTVQDFRDKRFYMWGGAGQELPRVPELTEYQERAFTESETAYRIAKYGARIAFSWEANINDKLRVFQQMPGQLAVASRVTEGMLAVRLYVDANGPHAAVYTAANKNVISGPNATGTVVPNPPLSLDSLKAGLAQYARRRDASGNRIARAAGIRLIVGQSLENTARQILDTKEIEITSGGKTVKIEGNGLNTNLELVVEEYIEDVATTNGDTSWFLAPAPNDPRPAFEVGFLAGHAQPELFIKSPDSRRIGGGDINPLDGDFRTDSIEYKVRHVAGGGVIDPYQTFASRGNGAA